MPPLAICSSSNCTYAVELHDNKNGTSLDTPDKCPVCKAPIISLCPQCGFLLLGEIDPSSPRCMVCRYPIRQAYARLRAHAHSG